MTSPTDRLRHPRGRLRQPGVPVRGAEGGERHRCTERSGVREKRKDKTLALRQLQRRAFEQLGGFGVRFNLVLKIFFGNSNIYITLKVLKKMFKYLGELG